MKKLEFKGVITPKTFGIKSDGEMAQKNEATELPIENPINLKQKMYNLAFKAVNRPQTPFEKNQIPLVTNPKNKKQRLFNVVIDAHNRH
ncbi:MAG: hypothetical protein AAF717_22780 [Bacteroidota bacterium]